MNNTLNVSYINIEKEKVATLNEVLTLNFNKMNDSYLSELNPTISINDLIIIKYEDLVRTTKKINNPVVLLLEKDLSRDELVKAFEYNIIDIILEASSKERLTTLVTKISAAYIYNKLPSNIVDYITKAPIKVKNLDLLKDYLEGYFKLFDETSMISFFIKTKDDFEYILGERNESVEDFISNLSLEDRYIGSYFKLSNNILIPVNNEGGNIIWIILDTSFKNMEFLNDLLFIHLKRINLYKKLKSSVGELTQMSMTDEVTELFNQRKLNADLELEVQTSLEQKQNFSLLFIDIDHFKRVNDNYGHVVGSKFLKDLGEVLVNQVRGTDSVYRYGGDEFIVLMRNTKTRTVYSVAKRMLSSVKDHTFKVNETEDYKMSISIGIAEFPKDAKSAKEIIEFADEMMYKSKDSGRGKVFHVKEISE